MTEDDVVAEVRAHVEGQFPRACTRCGQVYPDLVCFLRATKHVGDPVSYDLEVGDARPLDPAGTVALANCACGGTMAITSEGMSRWQVWRLMRWAIWTCTRERITFRFLLARIRDRIDAQVLGLPDPGQLRRTGMAPP